MLILLSDNKTIGSHLYELSKVRSFEKQQDLFNILHSEQPDHYSRLWLVGFLKHVGYSLEEICAIIHYEACWANYDTRMTLCQVQSVFKPGGKGNEATTGISSQFLKEGAAPGNFLQKVSDSVHEKQYDPKICIIGNSRITCHFKKCDICTLKVQK